MENNDKIILFEKKPVPSAVMTLAIPTIISSLVMVIYNLADTYFVGILNDPIENAAVTLAAPVLLAFNAVNNLFGVGASSMMSRALGKKEYKTVYQSSAMGFYCSLFCGILFSLIYTIFQRFLLVVLGADSGTISATAEYLKWTVSFGAAPAILNIVMAYLVRAEGASLHASIGTMSGCLLNMILDPFFILPWGLHMGAAGAGLATFLSNCAACLYFFILLYKKRNHTYVCLRFSVFQSVDRKEETENLSDQRNKREREKENKKVYDTKSIWKVLTGICAVGIPASIQNLLNVTSMAVLNNFTSSYGSDAVAAMGIAQKVNMVPMQIALGFSQGIMPLISYNYASGNWRRMKKALLFSTRLALLFLAVISISFYFGADYFISLFMKKQEIVIYGSRFLQGFCLGLVFLCMDFIAVGVFQACGMGKKSLLFAILRKIVLEIPALFLLNTYFPLYGLAYAQFLTEVVLSIAAILVLLKLFQKLQKEENDTDGRKA